jgi:hypothetical protein
MKSLIPNEIEGGQRSRTINENMTFFGSLFPLALGVLFATFGSTTGVCPSVDLGLYQGDGSGNAISLGTVSTVTTAQTVVEFYDYRGHSFHGDLPVAGDTSVITIHQDSNTCQLSLVIVHSSSWQRGRFGSAAFYVNGDLWNPLVKDDPSYTGLGYHDDAYDDHIGRRPGFTSVQWHWRPFETDGLAMPFVDNWVGCLLVDAIFNSKYDVPFGFVDNMTIEKWIYVSSGGVTTALSTVEGRQLNICFPGATPGNPGKDPFPRTDVDGECAEIGLETEPYCGVCERTLCHWHIICNFRRFLICHLGFDIPLVASHATP